eukprot:TRINITY_DN11413_c0_g1::TRINITY_DN11413_c0_g1_i1::g.26458::m.26458 TRINITY_DN11413_c0_g1::TRINITY_DN11413_c0_g1_i1::g.26458  ORF type:complete len:673 (+),score=125.92,PH/PF00169.24/3.5e-12,PH/PF00169.24/6.6e-05,PH/PF00169.24/0.023,PH_8/PF15409.1/0.12,PH_8/PF15409.1/64,PH_8/PF15409.1/4.8e+03 TRINITY_DN11413_c0_g1_i1:48-2066(+)
MQADSFEVIFSKENVPLFLSEPPYAQVKSGSDAGAKQGWMFTQGWGNKDYQKRFFILNHSMLYYCKSDSDKDLQNPLGAISLAGAKVQIMKDSPNRRFNFKIEAHTSWKRTGDFSYKCFKKREYYFSCDPEKKGKIDIDREAQEEQIDWVFKLFMESAMSDLRYLNSLIDPEKHPLCDDSMTKRGQRSTRFRKNVKHAGWVPVMPQCFLRTPEIVKPKKQGTLTLSREGASFMFGKNKYWFVMWEGYLLYFKSQKEMVLLGAVELAGSETTDLSPGKFLLEAESSWFRSGNDVTYRTKDTLTLEAENDADAQVWMKDLDAMKAKYEIEDTKVEMVPLAPSGCAGITKSSSVGFTVDGKRCVQGYLYVKKEGWKACSRKWCVMWGNFVFVMSSHLSELNPKPEHILQIPGSTVGMAPGDILHTFMDSKLDGFVFKMLSPQGMQTQDDKSTAHQAGKALAQLHFDIEMYFFTPSGIDCQEWVNAIDPTVRLQLEAAVLERQPADVFNKSITPGMGVKPGGGSPVPGASPVPSSSPIGSPTGDGSRSPTSPRSPRGGEALAQPLPRGDRPSSVRWGQLKTALKNDPALLGLPTAVPENDVSGGMPEKAERRLSMRSALRMKKMLRDMNQNLTQGDVPKIQGLADAVLVTLAQRITVDDPSQGAAEATPDENAQNE